MGRGAFGGCGFLDGVIYGVLKGFGYEKGDVVVGVVIGSGPSSNIITLGGVFLYDSHRA